MTIDANDPPRMVAFWAPLLGYEPQPPPDGFATWNDWYRAVGVPDDELDQAGDGCDRIHDPAGTGPPIWFQSVPERKSGLKNRLHLDVEIGGGRSVPLARRRTVVDTKVAELERLGARVIRPPIDAETTEHYYVLMADPEGSEFCIG